MKTKTEDFMIEPSISRELLEKAMNAIEQAAGYIFDGQPAVPFHPTTELLSLSQKEEETVRRGEEASYRTRPTASALSFCLTSSISLLAIAHSLVDQPTSLSPAEREQLWKKLASDTKTAGRAAYRAALILSDPAADSPGPFAPRSPGSLDAIQSIAQRDKSLLRAPLPSH